MNLAQDWAEYLASGCEDDFIFRGTQYGETIAWSSYKRWAGRHAAAFWRSQSDARRVMLNKKWGMIGVGFAKCSSKSYAVAYYGD